MSAARPAPGPWKRNRHDDVHDANGDLVCNVHGEDLGEQEANARLIAVAPEMLDLLLCALPYVEDALHDEVFKPDVVRNCIKQIRAVIAKAEAAYA